MAAESGDVPTFPATRLLATDELVAHVIELAADELENGEPTDHRRILMVAQNLRNIATDIRRPRALPT